MADGLSGIGKPCAAAMPRQRISPILKMSLPICTGAPLTFVGHALECPCHIVASIVVIVIDARDPQLGIAASKGDRLVEQHPGTHFLDARHHLEPVMISEDGQRSEFAVNGFEHVLQTIHGFNDRSADVEAVIAGDDAEVVIEFANDLPESFATVDMEI